MKRKFLEDLGLEKDVIDKIMDENSADIGRAKGEFENVKTELDSTKKMLSDRDKQLEELKKTSGDAESLKAQIEKLQNENKAKDEAHEAEIKQLKVDSAVASAITNAKGKNAKAIKALLDLTKAELDDDGNVKGLKEQLEALMKSDDSKFMFDTETKKPNVKGATVGEPSDEQGEKTITKEQFRKMSYKDKVKIYNEDKELYDSLNS